MPIITLTDLAVRSLKPTAGRQVTYLDKTLKGFGVRVGAGSMTYVLTYGPNRTRVKLGEVGVLRLADARHKARSLLAERQLGIHQHKGGDTYRTALDAFLEASKAKNRPRTLKDYTRLLTSHGFGAEKLADITPKDVARNLAKLADRPGEKAHAQAALKIFFAYCVRNSLLDASPMLRVERIANAEGRSRILTEPELKAVWKAADGMFGTIIKLCILLEATRK